MKTETAFPGYDEADPSTGEDALISPLNLELGAPNNEAAHLVSESAQWTPRERGVIDALIASTGFSEQVIMRRALMMFRDDVARNGIPRR